MIENDVKMDHYTQTKNSPPEVRLVYFNNES